MPGTNTMSCLQESGFLPSHYLSSTNDSSLDLIRAAELAHSLTYSYLYFNKVFRECRQKTKSKASPQLKIRHLVAALVCLGLRLRLCVKTIGNEVFVSRALHIYERFGC